MLIFHQTWDTLLSFLLAINDALLAPPAVKDDVGDQLCERVLGVLYEIWLLACVKVAPRTLIIDGLIKSSSKLLM